MAVGIPGQDVFGDEVLHLPKGAARRDVIRVQQRLRAAAGVEAHAVADALAYGVRVTGCTVHLVDAGTDTGPIVAQQAVPVLDGDDEATLHERIKVIERELLVDVLAALATRGVTWTGRKATIG